jgi:hypothetical protein
MANNRKSLGEIFRPTESKLVTSGQPMTGQGGNTVNIAQAIDLSLPIRGLRLVFKGRLVIGTAAFTSGTPEGFLNLIQDIKVFGTNARQKGNVTLWDLDLATLWTMQHLFGNRAASFTISTTGVGGETFVPKPTTPFPANGASGYFNVATGTYDWRIVVDIPFAPFKAHGFGKQPLVVPGFLVRNEEWKDSLQVQIQFGSQSGNSTGSLGVAAATTTVTFSSYGSGSGTPTVDLYSLPVVMGLDLKDTVLPGVCSRVQSPINTVLQAAGTNAVLANLQKQPTMRVIVKTGTTTVGAVAPAFATLSDTNVTASGILLGGNRNVRNKVDIFAHKQQQPDTYDTDPIQGYLVHDFQHSGNPDSAYPGQDVGDGAAFQLLSDVTGVANAFGIVVQEQILHLPTGDLYTY